MKKLSVLTTTFLLLGAYTAAGQWTQLGTDINGRVPGSYAGAVSLNASGSLLAVGARQDGTNDPGYVEIYDWNGTIWTMTPNGYIPGGSGSNSGKAVSLDSAGTRVAIGAPTNGGVGYARVYEWNGSGWLPAGSIIMSDTSSNAFGWEVDLSANGNRLAIAAPFSSDNGRWAGMVRAFDWSGTDWVQAGSDIEGNVIDDRWGISLSLSADGNHVAAGGIYNNSSAGHAKVYSWNGSAWVQRGNDIDGQAPAEFLGASVSLNGDGSRVAVGGDGINSTGGVRVYDWNGSAWVQAGSDITGGANDNSFGWGSSISADGNRLAIGDYNNSSSDTSSGQVRVYDWNGSAWVQVGSDIDGEAKGDQSGRAVCLNAEGSRLAIGAPYNDGNGTHSGHARVYGYSAPVSIDMHNKIIGFVSVFPNSFSHQLTFSLTNNEQITVSLYDFLARQIFQQTFANTTTINTEQFADGIYFYELRSEKGLVKTGKVVKE